MKEGAPNSQHGSTEREPQRANKAGFWQAHASERPFSPRQQKVLTRLLADVEGHLAHTLTAPKWANLCRCSVDTAQRDIADLVERGLLRRNPGGSKRTSYTFSWSPADGGARPAIPSPRS